MHHNSLIQHSLSNSQSTHNHHPTAQSSNLIQRNKTDEDDLEILAKKKKNADAQAAFRLRRQTYIKSLEDTVTELQNAVKEMEVLVKTANLEVKIKCEQVSYLENKMKQEQTGIPSSSNPSTSHCNCCRFSTTYNQSTKLVNQTHSLALPTQSNPTRQTTSANTSANTAPTNSGSATNTNTSSTIANHSILNSAPHTPLEAQSNEWSTASNSHRPYPSILTSSSHHQPSPTPSHLLPDSRHPTKLEANQLYDRSSSNEHESTQGSHSTNSYNPRCDMTFFDAYNLNQTNPPQFYSSSDTVLNPNHHGNPTSLDLSSNYTRSNPTTPRQLLPTQYPPSSSTSGTCLSHNNKSYPLNFGSVLDDHHPHSFPYDDEHSQHQQNKRRREDEMKHVHKLNGLPAKVARCEQTVMEVSKVVLQAKEQAQLVASEQQKRIMKLNSQPF